MIHANAFHAFGTFCRFREFPCTASLRDTQRALEHETDPMLARLKGPIKLELTSVLVVAYSLAQSLAFALLGLSWLSRRLSAPYSLRISAAVADSVLVVADCGWSVGCLSSEQGPTLAGHKTRTKL